MTWILKSLYKTRQLNFNWNVTCIAAPCLILLASFRFNCSLYSFSLTHPLSLILFFSQIVLTLAKTINTETQSVAPLLGNCKKKKLCWRAVYGSKRAKNQIGPTLSFTKPHNCFHFSPHFILISHENVEAFLAQKR